MAKPIQLKSEIQMKINTQSLSPKEQPQLPPLNLLHPILLLPEQ